VQGRKIGAERLLPLGDHPRLALLEGDGGVFQILPGQRAIRGSRDAELLYLLQQTRESGSLRRIGRRCRCGGLIAEPGSFLIVTLVGVLVFSLIF
jgi:hypothetical protein